MCDEEEEEEGEVKKKNYINKLAHAGNDAKSYKEKSIKAIELFS